MHNLSDLFPAAQDNFSQFLVNKCVKRNFDSQLKLKWTVGI